MDNPQDIIEKLGLKPHPEGGHYKRTHTSDEMVQTERGKRHAMTSIYYILLPGEISKIHKIQSDERWYYHKGSALRFYIFNEQGIVEELLLGPIDKNGEYSICIPANTWFAAKPDIEDSYSLASCAVCPGFDFNDFELANKNTMLQQFPQHKNIIENLT